MTISQVGAWKAVALFRGVDGWAGGHGVGRCGFGVEFGYAAVVDAAVHGAFAAGGCGACDVYAAWCVCWE